MLVERTIHSFLALFGRFVHKQSIYKSEEKACMMLVYKKNVSFSYNMPTMASNIGHWVKRRKVKLQASDLIYFGEMDMQCLVFLSECILAKEIWKKKYKRLSFQI